jgi:hypothetical protein
VSFRAAPLTARDRVDGGGLGGNKASRSFSLRITARNATAVCRTEIAQLSYLYRALAAVLAQQGDASRDVAIQTNFHEPCALASSDLQGCAIAARSPPVARLHLNGVSDSAGAASAWARLPGVCVSALVGKSGDGAAAVDCSSERWRCRS